MVPLFLSQWRKQTGQCLFEKFDGIILIQDFDCEIHTTTFDDKR